MAPAGTRLERMLLLLDPSAGRQQALVTELQNQQNPRSPEFHHWLTPAAFAAAYGNSLADVSEVCAWLQSQGFKVAPLPAGLGWIEFSGTAGQVEQAFHAKVESAAASAGTRPVLASGISVPAALKPVIHGLVSLDGTVSAPALTGAKPVSTSPADLAAATSMVQAEALTPALLAQSLHLDPLHASGFLGAGETVAIAGRSNLNSSDVAAFRSAFALPVNPVSVVPNGSDPGQTDDVASVTLAASWAGAAAPGASILVVPAATTSATDGVDLSLAAIVDQALAHTVVVGYSSCEAALSEPHQAFYAALYRQAAAEGIAVIAAAGDSGPSACHLAGSDAPVTSGYAVNALASTPWNTSVGVAALGATGSGTGDSPLLAWSPVSAADPGYAGGGGSSTLYAAPNWQPAPDSAALPAASNSQESFGGPAAGFRLLPDLALPTALDSGVNRGLAFCLSGSESSSGCTLVRGGGSSAAAALFAGIAALVAGKNGAQGNLAPNLYALSRSPGIFDDVQQGSAHLPCVASSPGCGPVEEIGFSAVSGYDLATGLGSVNAQALVTQWANPMGNGSILPTVTITSPSSSTTINPSASITIEAQVTGSSGTPTGTVTFYDTTTLTNLSSTASAVNSSGVAQVVVEGVFSPKDNLIEAIYNGDSVYQSADSPTVDIVTQPSVTSLTIQPSNSSPSAGATITVTATLTVPGPPAAGTAQPTGTVTLSVDGANPPQSTSLVSNTATFNVTVPARGSQSLQAAYSGDPNYAGFTTPVTYLTVSTTATSTAITQYTASPAAGSTFQVTATITPLASSSSTPTGNVSFTLNGTAVGSATVSGGTATTTITAPASGTYSLVAIYGGDGNFTGSTSTSVTVTVSKISTTTSVTPSTTTPAAGASMQVSATVTPSTTGSSSPTGTVTFTLDGVTAGSATLGSSTTVTTTITAPSAGTHNLVAVYSGDSNYAGSNSPTATLTVAKNATTLGVSTSSSPTAGSPMQLVATISANSQGSITPTGTVTFTLDGASAGSATVSGTTATLSITAPSAGSHTVQASYGGDTNFSASTASGSFTVGKGTTTLTVTPPSTPPLGGSSMLVTATLNATYSGSLAPTGTVTFTMDGTSQGTVALANGSTASITITAPASGTHSLQASYSGDTNYNSATSQVASFTVAKTTTTLVVVPSTTTPALGATVPVTATVTAATLGSTPPTGTVTFALDGATVGAVAVSGYPATANITLAAMTPGSHTLTATYSGDTYYATSNATAATITVPKSPTTMIVTPATVTPAGGSSLLVTATITATNPGATVPTGTVAFTLDGANVGTQAVVAGYPSTATITIPSLTPGTHILEGTYSGDTYYGTSTSPAVTLTVSKGATTTVLTPSTITPTAGSSMTVTVTITSPNPAATQPTGSVNITEDGTSVATGTVVPGVPSTATVTIPLVSAGSHLLQATYSGDTYYTGSTSPAVSIVAAKGITVTTVTASPASLTAGVNESLTATIAPLNPVTGATYTITGTVSFYDGGATLLGTVNIAANTATLAGVKLADNINHSITAVYSGDVNWVGSTSVALPLEASTLPDTVVLTSNFSTLQPGQALVLTATVTPTTLPVAGAEANPTGQVVFYYGTTVIGQVALAPVALTDASTATLTIQTLPGGQDTVFATYLGDLYYDVNTSNLLTLTIQDFTITPAASNPPTNVNIVKGAAGSASFIVSGLGGFNNEVSLICTVPSQDDMTCTASPQQVVPTATVTFVVQTFTTGATTAYNNKKREPFWPRAAGGTALAALVFFLLPFGRRARIFTGRAAKRFWILLLLLVGLGGAGIGCNNVSLVSASGTPLGVATIQVIGTAYVDNTVVSKNVYFTVNVTAAP